MTSPAGARRCVLLGVLLVAAPSVGGASSGTSNASPLSRLVADLEAQLPPLQPASGVLRVAVASEPEATQPGALEIPPPFVGKVEGLAVAALQARYGGEGSGRGAVLRVSPGPGAAIRARRIGATHLLRLTVRAGGRALSVEGTVAPLSQTLWDEVAGRPPPLTAHLLASAPLGAGLRQMLALPPEPARGYHLTDLGELPLSGPILALAVRWVQPAQEVEVAAVDGAAVWVGRIVVGLSQEDPAGGSAGTRSRTVTRISLADFERSPTPSRDPLATLLFWGTSDREGVSLALGHSALRFGQVIGLATGGARNKGTLPGLPLVVDPSGRRVLVDTLAVGRSSFAGRSRWVALPGGSVQGAGPPLTAGHRGAWGGPSGGTLVLHPGGRLRPASGAKAPSLRGVGACVAVADLDGDAAPEILACSQGLDRGSDRLRSRRAADGEVLWKSVPLQGWLYAVAAAGAPDAATAGVAVAGLNPPTGGPGRLLLLELR